MVVECGEERNGERRRGEGYSKGAEMGWDGIDVWESRGLTLRRRGGRVLLNEPMVVRCSAVGRREHGVLSRVQGPVAARSSVCVRGVEWSGVEWSGAEQSEREDCGQTGEGKGEWGNNREGPDARDMRGTLTSRVGQFAGRQDETGRDVTRLLVC